LELLRRHLPKTATLLAALPARKSRGFRTALAETFPRCENISVDFAIMEKVKDVVGIPADDIGWNDVGSWNAVYELLPRDSASNVSVGDVLLEGSAGNYVEGPKGKLVALVGVRDLVVVDTPEALLVVDRNAAQRVSDLVKKLEARKRDDLL
jgi:mannose-1-phosphate guanylyltransferase